MASRLLDQLDTYGPDHCEAMSPERAVAYTARLARTHLENFHVASWLLPKAHRQDFFNVYAFCRWADDLADETGDRDRSLALLDWWRREVDACYAGSPRHPVFVALSGTVEAHAIPREPFDHLIDAFVQDQRQSRYETWDQVIDYCSRSANPVGRLVLYVTGYRDAARQRLSDATCTALQLANFWQDVRRDVLERDRVYIPQDVAGRHGLSVNQLVQVLNLDGQHQSGGTSCSCAACSATTVGVTAIKPAYTATVRELVARTQPLFDEGRRLLPMLDPTVRSDVELFTLGGETVLKLIARQRFNTLEKRPSPSKLQRMLLLGRVALHRWTGGPAARPGSGSEATAGAGDDGTAQADATAATAATAGAMPQPSR